MGIINFNHEICGLCDSIVKESEAIKDYTFRLNETQSETMRGIYADNRMDELPHIQNLAVALTALINGEEPTEAARMDGSGSLRTDKYKAGKGDKRITVECNDREGYLQGLFEYLKELSDKGHSFDIVVDPNNPEYEKTFGMDGDGFDHIRSVEAEELYEGDEDE